MNYHYYDTWSQNIHLLNRKWFYCVAGTENVVLGDLVYCKENSTGKVTESVGSEYAEDCSGRYDSNNEDEISGEIHEEIDSVKVRLLVLAHCRGLLVLNWYVGLEICHNISFSSIYLESSVHTWHNV